jgi:methyl-accepting chemotaxis protein
MKEILTSVEKVAAIVERISLASREQADGIEQVNRAIGQMDQVVQQNAAVVEQAAAAAESMRNNARQLVESVGEFKLDDTVPFQVEHRSRVEMAQVARPVPVSHRMT